MILQERAGSSVVVLRWILPALGLLVLLTGAATARAADASVQYVDCDRGNDASSGLTPETAKRTVQAAIHGVPGDGPRTVHLSGDCTAERVGGDPPNRVKSHKCAADLRHGVANFKLRFERRPDFFTVDELDRQAFAFQLFVEAAGPPQGIGDFYAAAAGEADATAKTIVRGEEIHLDDDVRIRGIVPFYDGEPGSGGWGPIVDAVPYELEDNAMSFDVPLASLRDGGDGRLWYFVEWYEYGTWSGVTLIGTCRATAPRPPRDSR